MKNVNQTSKGRDVYAIVTNRIVALLEQGVIPWRKTWTESGLPQNLITGKPYRGINLWLLASLNYRHNYFLTFRQAKELGGAIRKGEKGHIVVFTKWTEEEKPGTNEKVKKAILRSYIVFNVAQCDGIPNGTISEPIVPSDSIGECRDILARMPQCPPIHYESGGPYYNRLEDYINMPLWSDFENGEEFYITLFHELIHSTGHESRLNRKESEGSSKVCIQAYSVEELIAELGACYLMSYAGIQQKNLSNSAAYIEGWLGQLKSDKRMIVYASAHAQRAVEFILNSAPEPVVKEEREALHE